MKTKKILIILSIIFIVSFCFYTISVADSAELDPKTAMTGMKDDATNADGADTIKPVINAVIGTLQVAGTGIALIMISILGIKYMMAAPNDKADVKKQITPMVIGAILLFGAVNIIQIIANFTEKTFG